MDSLLDSFTKLVTPHLLSSLSSSLGESESATSKTLAAAAPAVLAGMLGKTSDRGAMGMLDGLLRDTANDGSLLDNVGSLLGGTSPMGTLGGSLLSSVFGGQLGSLGGALAQIGGVKPTTASSLLGMAAPILMSLIGSRMRQSGLGLGALLDGQRTSIQAAVPAGLQSVLAMVGHATSAAGTHAPTAHHEDTDHAAVPLNDNPSVRGLLTILPVLAGIAVVGTVLGSIMFGVGIRPDPNPAPASPRSLAPAAEHAPAHAAAAAIPSTPWPDLGAFAPRVLPRSVGTINIPARGIESKLLAFVESAAPVDTTTWFDFDRILFDTSAATLRSESNEQLENIASILKAFPAVALRVGGYTDNTGSAAANVRLSQARAETVMGALVARGVEATRLSAQGYGAEHPVADNTTEEGRQKNRRVSVRVTKK